MGTFVDRVRQGEISHPTQRTFKIQAWRDAFGAISSPDVQDTELFEAGLFVDRILAGLRQKLTEGRFQSATRAERLGAICGLINHETAVLKKKIDDGAARSRECKDTIFVLVCRMRSRPRMCAGFRPPKRTSGPLPKYCGRNIQWSRRR